MSVTRPKKGKSRAQMRVSTFSIGFKKLLMIVIICVIGSLQAVPKQKTSKQAGAKQSRSKRAVAKNAVDTVPFAVKQKAKKFKAAELVGIETLALSWKDERKIPNKPFVFRCVVWSIRHCGYVTCGTAQQAGKFDGLIMFTPGGCYGDIKENVRNYMALGYYQTSTRIEKDLKKVMGEEGKFVELYLMLEKNGYDIGITDVITGEKYNMNDNGFKIKDFMTIEDYNKGNDIDASKEVSTADSWEVSTLPVKARKAEIDYKPFVYKAKINISTYFNYAFADKEDEYYSFSGKRIPLLLTRN